MENAKNSNSPLEINSLYLEKINKMALRSLNKQHANVFIFTEEDLQVLEKNGKKEPDWRCMFFDWMTDSMKALYFPNLHQIYNQASLCFIKGLLNEHKADYGKFLKPNKEGEYENDYAKALDYYLLGAKLNNQYCLFKLFYILKDKSNSKKFGIKKNIDLSIFYLIKASSYNESFLDINKIDPIIKLMHIVYYRDKELNRIRKLLEKMKYVNNEMNILIDDSEYKYLFNFLRLNFCNRDYEFKDALFQLEQICDSHPESCYKLACFYYNPFHRIITSKNVEKSIALFKSLFDKNYTKSYCSYYKICEEQKLSDRIEDVLMSCKKMKSYASQFYANFLSRKKDDVFLNSQKIFKYFFNSLLYGNLISIVICFEIMSQIFLKNMVSVNASSEKFDMNKYKPYLNAIFDFVSTKKNDQTMYKILDYDILILFHQIHAYFYYKGIIVKKDVRKAIEILESTFADRKSIKNYRKVFYYLGKAYRKIGDYKKSNMYFKQTFEIYIMLKEFPYHHYIVAKLFLHGIPGIIGKNIVQSYYFFTLGATYKDNYYFINSFYSKKCMTYLQEDNELIDFYNKNKEEIDMSINLNNPAESKFFNFSLDQFVNDENICIVCFSNFKQIIYVKCGHKSLCYLCFEKLSKNDLNLNKTATWKCPMCQQESNAYVNSFEVDYA